MPKARRARPAAMRRVMGWPAMVWLRLISAAAPGTVAPEAAAMGTAAMEAAAMGAAAARIAMGLGLGLPRGQAARVELTRLPQRALTRVGAAVPVARPAKARARPAAKQEVVATSVPPCLGCRREFRLRQVLRVPRGGQRVAAAAPARSPVAEVATGQALPPRTVPFR